MTNDEDTKIPFFIYIVVFSKVLVSMAISYGVLYLIAPFLGVPRFPVVTEGTFITTGAIAWIVLFAVIGFIVIGVLYYPISAVAWGTAYALSPTAREEMDEIMEEMDDDSA